MSRTSVSTNHSQASSVTMTEPARDVESRRPSNKLTYFQRQFELAGVSTAVLEWRYRGKGTEDEPYIVDFLPNDPKDPMHFKDSKKWFITIIQAIAVLAVAFVSTAYTGGISEVLEDFQVSQTIVTLGISLFVTGFALGPLVWAPLSELYGRQIIFFISYMALTAFNAGAGGAQNIQTLIVLRFLAGTFGSSPLTNSGGVIGDMFSAKQRGLATSAFAAAPFLGPAIGPIVGGFLGEAAGWRWVEGLMAAFTGTLWILCSVTVPETYAPVLLRKRAAKLSQMTGKVYLSKLDVGQPKKTVSQEFKVALSRPWKLLFLEPIVALLSLYIAIVYGILYMLFAAYPIVFQQQRGWSPGIGGLAFLGLAVGMLMAVGYNAYDNIRYSNEADKNGGNASPEARLPPSIIGAFLLPVGLLWFAWTNGPEIHWVVPIIASSFFGAGIVLLFLSLMNYLIDSYLIYAASVLAASSVLRSLFGAAFPLFTSVMYQNLGIHWASSIPGFLSLACVPFPFLFYKYGAGIRMKCKYASEAAEMEEKMQARGDDEEESGTNGYANDS